MALDTYAGLQAAILVWLARPGDQLLVPAVPDMIRLFEAEASRRLHTAGAEKTADVTADAVAVPLPGDCVEVRVASIGDTDLQYVTPDQLPGQSGNPLHYTIVGHEILLGPAPSGTQTVHLIYQGGVPLLSDLAPSNWLLEAAPDAYLFGSLVEAEAFIGEDERAQLWLARREAAFEAIGQADRKARWPGALQMRVA